MAKVMNKNWERQDAVGKWGRLHVLDGKRRRRNRDGERVGKSANKHGKPSLNSVMTTEAQT